MFSGLAMAAARTSLAATGRVEIIPDDKIGVVSPDIYGHFTEHLGGCIYDGIWVGENSPVPNVGGIRKALVDGLKRLKPPVIRWPGGCFADSYNWRDGVGPRAQRPRRTNFWAASDYLAKGPDGPQKYDPNHFGTNEFARFCRLAGAEPYLAANVRSAPARDFYEWIEYCNSPAGATTLADLRAAGGDREPFNVRYWGVGNESWGCGGANVRYWGVGNESWGCGGAFTGDEYAIEYRRFVEWVPRFSTPLHFIPSGPNAGDHAWTRSFLTKLTEKGPRALRSVYGLALHYYAGTTGKGSSTDFTTDDWYGMMARTVRMEDLIRAHWQIMGEIDTQRQIKLIVDEWGAWHRTADVAPNFLFGYFPSMRDALVSGLTLDTFNRHADKIAMANAAQLINNIHSSFMAHGDKFVATPIAHVFEMYAAHQGATSVRTEISSPRLKNDAAKGMSALAGSCSVQGGRGVLTVTNSEHADAIETEVGVRGGRISGIRATVLKSSDMRAHNSFENTNAVEPAAAPVNGGGAQVVYSFAPASVTRLEFTIA
jgi:alpha-L-arabinofuranosidase